MTTQKSFSFGLSIVCPVFGAAGEVSELVSRLSKAAGQVCDDWEIVLVEDGSPDASWPEIVSEARQSERVVAIRLSRNFGQQRAIAAGLAAAHKQRIVVIDCDLQDPPEAMVDMWNAMDDGADIVYTRRCRRRDGVGKRLTSWLFFKMMYWLSDAYLAPGISSFSMISTRVRNAYLQTADEHTLYVAGLHWMGFHAKMLDLPHNARTGGRSGYTFAKRLRLAVDALVSQSDRLLYGSIAGGFVFALLALAGAGSLIMRKIFEGIPVPGWASLAVLTLVVGGAIMISLGITGLYIGRIFERVKDRPLYLVREELNLNKQKCS